MNKTNSLYPCPVCGFLTFDGGPGSYAVCPICDWEDDAIQLRYPGMAGGANGYALCREQQRMLKHYPLSVQEAKGYRRDPEWRPLRPEEIVTAGMPETGRSYFDALSDPPSAYYWRSGETAAERPQEEA